MAFGSFMNRLKVILFQDLCRTLSVSFKMVFVNIIALEVLKILHNLVFMQKSLFEITADVNTITKFIQRDLNFIFNEISENMDSFCVNVSSGRDKICYLFRKNLFFFSKRGQLSMCKSAEIYHGTINTQVNTLLDLTNRKLRNTF